METNSDVRRVCVFAGELPVITTARWSDAAGSRPGWARRAREALPETGGWGAGTIRARLTGLPPTQARPGVAYL